MVSVTIDGVKHTGKEVVISDWSGHAKKEFIHFFSDDYDKAEEMSKGMK